MSSGLAESGEFEQQTENTETNIDAVARYRFDPRRIMDIIGGDIDLSDPQNQWTAAYLASTAEELSDSTVRVCDELAGSEDYEHQLMAAGYMMEILKNGVASGAMSHSQMDSIRDSLGSLLQSEDDDIREEAERVFKKNQEHMLQHDMVTFERIGWLVSPQVFILRPHRGYSTDAYSAHH
jgi:hypothetical protein